MVRRVNGLGIQSVGSSCDKKVIVLETEIYCVWLFYNLFINGVNI